MTPEFQNTYGNKKDMYESWGENSPLLLIMTLKKIFSTQELTLSTH